MTQIEQPTCALTEAIKPLLPPLLVQVADHRVLEGFRKYGQVLSDNHKPLRKKVVHHVQELLDALNYNEWELQDLARHEDHLTLMFEAMTRQHTYIRHLFELLALVPDLTFEELTHKEGHSESDRLRADLAAAQARVAELEAENAALREQGSLYRLDNDGHMECLAETHQDLLCELPDSETTAQLGRLLDRWQRTPGQRQYVALSELKEVQEKAALWDAFMGCARIRVMGSGGLDLNTQAVPANGYAHLYVELWTVYDWAAFKDDAALTAREQTSHARSRAYLELYARTAQHRAALLGAQQ